MAIKRPKHEEEEIQRRLEALFDSEGEKLVKDVLWEHYISSMRQIHRELDEGRRGFGIYPDAWERWERNAIDEATNAIQPIQARIELGAMLAFKRILVGILKDPVLRQMWIQDNARIVGKKGGRPEGSEAPHIQWLRERLEFNERCDPRPSAKEHFQKLERHPDVYEVDEQGNLRLSMEILEELGWQPGKKEPAISPSSVSALLTKIRRGE